MIISCSGAREFFFLPNVRNIFSSRLRFRFFFYAYDRFFSNDIEAGIGFFSCYGKSNRPPPQYINIVRACVCALSQCVRDSMSFTARVRRIPLRVGFDFSFFSSDEILSVRASDRVGPVGGLTFRVRMRIFSAAANRITRYSFLKKMIRLGYFFKSTDHNEKKD